MQDVGTDDADDVVNADRVESAEVDESGDIDINDSDEVESEVVNEAGDVVVAENSDVVEAADDNNVVLVAEAVTYVTYEIVPRTVPEAACVTREVASYVVVDTTLVVS